MFTLAHSGICEIERTAFLFHGALHLHAAFGDSHREASPRSGNGFVNVQETAARHKHIEAASGKHSFFMLNFRFKSCWTIQK